MKKQAFGTVAALFALMLALIAGAYAADTPTAAEVVGLDTATATETDAAEPDAPANADATAETEIAELSAANIAYAILYEDGTLVFQNSETPETGRAVKATYEVDLTAIYTQSDKAFKATTPWCDECESIRVIDFAEKISPTSTAYWFYSCNKLECIDNIRNLDTTSVTDMKYMFSFCRGLTTLDLSSFNTVNVTNMSGMFNVCSNLTALNVSHFDTSKVTDMVSMFGSCGKLTTLDLSHFDTGNVTNMGGMFLQCTNLATLNVSHWDTSNVTDMHSMFHDCIALKSLDVSHWDTSNVRTTLQMFWQCTNLTTLDVSHWDTANVTNMSSMFHGCSSLKVLDVSHFDTSKVTLSMAYMFGDCRALTTLDVSNFDTAKVTSTYGMFYCCRNLKTIYASDKFVTKYGSGMFYGCTSLVGGNGTKYDYHDDNMYARIDAPGMPGYFTYKEAAPVVAYAIIAAEPRNGTLSVTLANPGAATVAAAYFDANGKFVSVNLQDAQANAGTVEISIPANAKAARAMLLDGDCRPLCAAFAADV